MIRASLLLVLACVASSVIGCASTPGIGAPALVEISPAVAVGTWALADERNVTFNVVLREDGSATSTWSRGNNGAAGEQGGWSIRDGVLTVRYSDGWIDTIRMGRFGYEKLSYGPMDRDTNLPSSFGQAVKVLEDSRVWVGVWRPTSVRESAKGQELLVCMSSDGAAVKDIDAINTGCWQNQSPGAAIYWSDGWFTQLSRNGDVVTGKSWAPGADRTGEPTGEQTWVEVIE